MIKEHLKRLVDVGQVIGSLAFVVLAWYAYLVLKRGDLYMVILASLFFGSCSLVGFVALSTQHRKHWFRLDSQDLSSGHNLTLAIVGVAVAVCLLWLTLSRDLHILLKTTFVFGFFYFGWQAWVKFKHALHPSDK